MTAYPTPTEILLFIAIMGFIMAVTYYGGDGE